MSESFYPTILTILGGAVGYFLRYYLDKRKEIISKNIENKRVSYESFIAIVVDILKIVKNPNTAEQKNKINEIENNLYNIQKTFLLFAPPKLVNTFGDFMQYLYTHGGTQDPKETIKLLSKLIKSMRSDLALSNKTMGIYGEKLFRPLLKDFNDYF